MDRSYEEVEAAAFELDPEGQRRLASALSQHLSNAEFQEAALIEAERRLEAVDRGEMQIVDGAEAMARVRKLLKR
jgi:hypothetical protein